MEINLRYLLKQTFWVYIFAYLAAPLAYLIRILYARSFSVEEFGLIYSIMGIIGLISIFNDLGFTETLNYYATRFYEKKQYSKVKGSLIFAFLMQGGTALLLVLTFYFLSPLLAEYYFKTEIAVSTFRWFLLYFLFLNISKPFIQLFMATHNYYYGMFAEFFRTFVILLLSSLILFYPGLKNLDYIGAVWGVGFISLFVLFYYLSKAKFPKIYGVKAELSFGLYKKLFNYAIVVMIGSGAVLLLSRIDIFFLTYFKGLYEVGLYSVALSLGMGIPILIGPAINMIFPLTSKLSVNKDSFKIKEMIKTIYGFGLYLIIPVLIVFVSYPKEIINLLFGVKYVGAYVALIILSFAYFINVLASFNFQIMAGLGLVKKRTKILYFAAFTNIVADLILIPIYGLIGAAIGTLLSILVMFVLGYMLINKRFSLNLNKNRLYKTIVGGVLIFLIVTLLKKIIITNIFIEAAIIGIIVLIVYGGVGYYWKIVDFKRIKELIWRT